MWCQLSKRSNSPDLSFCFSALIINSSLMGANFGRCRCTIINTEAQGDARVTSQGGLLACCPWEPHRTRGEKPLASFPKLLFEESRKPGIRKRPLSIQRGTALFGKQHISLYVAFYRWGNRSGTQIIAPSISQDAHSEHSRWGVCSAQPGLQSQVCRWQVISCRRLSDPFPAFPSCSK